MDRLLEVDDSGIDIGDQLHLDDTVVLVTPRAEVGAERLPNASRPR